MSKVWQLQLPHREKHILLALADHADDQGRNVFPSIGYTAWKSDYSERTVQKVMRRFREEKTLIVTKKAGRRTSTVYRIDLSQIPEKPPLRGEEIAPQEEEVQSTTLRGAKSSVRGAKSSVRGEVAGAPKSSSESPFESSGNGEGVEAAPRPDAPPVARGSAAPLGFEDPEWEQDADLREFLLSKKFVDIPLDYFSNNAWWTRASIGCRGITVPFLERTFAALGNHFDRKPQTRPMTKAGWQQKMTNFLRIEREIVNREQARVERDRFPRRAAYAR